MKRLHETCLPSGEIRIAGVSLLDDAMAIGLHYRGFRQLSDEDVVPALAKASSGLPTARPDATTAADIPVALNLWRG